MQNGQGAAKSFSILPESNPCLFTGLDSLRLVLTTKPSVRNDLPEKISIFLVIFCNLGHRLVLKYFLFLSAQVLLNFHRAVSSLKSEN